MLDDQDAVLKLGVDGRLWIGVVDGLMDADKPEEVVLDNAEVEKNAVGVPGNTADYGASHGVENEVVGRGNDGCEDERWV